MTLYVVMAVHRWEDIGMTCSLPIPHLQLKGSPVPGCIGWLAVFADQAKAEAFAGELPISAIEGETCAGDPQDASGSEEDLRDWMDRKERQWSREEPR